MDTRSYNTTLATEPTAAFVPSTMRPCGVLLKLSHIATTYALSQVPVPPVTCFEFPRALVCFTYRSCESYTGIEYGTTLVVSAFFVVRFGPMIHIDVIPICGANTIRTFFDLRNVCMGLNRLAPCGSSVP